MGTGMPMSYMLKTGEGSLMCNGKGTFFITLDMIGGFQQGLGTHRFYTVKHRRNFPFRGNENVMIIL